MSEAERLRQRNAELEALVQKLQAQLQSTVEDERKQAEEELREGEERFRQLAENIQQIFWMYDVEKRQLIYISPVCQPVLGYDSASCYDKSLDFWLAHIRPDDLKPVLQTSRQAVRGKVSEATFRFTKPNGQERWLMARAFPVRNAQGKVYRIAGIAEDISDRKQAEAEMQKALEKERELSELKSRFVSTTSHEFRTPLSTILSSADLLEFYAGHCPPEKQLEHLHRIQSAALNMNNLLNDVLMIERAEVKKLRFEPTSLDLRSFCQTLVEEMQLNDHGKHRICFESSTTEPIRAGMDEKLLRQIFTNLISNALKYSPVGSKVKFRLEADQTRALVEVQDEGIGISPEDQVRLFEPFHRGNNVGTVSGNGLGLAIVKQSVDVHGGQITVSSQENQGTIVHVTLPLNSLGS